MSFEFDPNDNNDRAVDGNDLHDIGCLGGVVREDSLEESPVDPKLELPIDPKDMPKVANP